MIALPMEERKHLLMLVNEEEEDLERSVGEMKGFDMGQVHLDGSSKIIHEKEIYPYCIVWTPLPMISWFLPFIGNRYSFAVKMLFAYFLFQATLELEIVAESYMTLLDPIILVLVIYHFPHPLNISHWILPSASLRVGTKVCDRVVRCTNIACTIFSATIAILMSPNA